ncbi:hypothetical protein QTP70_032325, partial [Hemibagrus guttatus]
AFGYEENEQGDLYMQKPPRIDQSLGPAYYSPTQIEPKYKGVHFGQMTQKRTEMKGVPGPGQYDIKGQFEKSSGVSVSSPAFLSQTARFCSVKDVVPPVGSYNDPRCALESLNKHNGVKRSPFNLTAARFTPEHRKNTTPGPGAYNMFDYGLANESLKKAQLEGKKVESFGSTAKRSTIFIGRTTEPGPTHYLVEEKREALYKQQPTAVFKSALERLPASLDAKDTPSPSSYNVREAYEKMFGQGGHGEPRTKAARKRQSSFLSTAPRSSSFHYDSHIPASCAPRDVRQMLLKLVELRSSNWGRVQAAAAYSEATPDNDPNYYM